MEKTIKVLLISDNEALNNLYQINLNVYLGALVETVSKIETIATRLKEGDFDLVISLTTLNDQDTYPLLQELKRPLIIIGAITLNRSDVVVVSNSYQLQIIIKEAARILNITAKDMANKEVDQFFSLPANLLTYLEKSPVNVFLCTKKNSQGSTMILVCAKNAEMETSLKLFSEEKIENVYVKSEDRLVVVNEISKNLLREILTLKTAKIEEKNEVLTQGFDFVCGNFCQTDDGKEELINLANGCLKLMDGMVREVSSFKAFVNILNGNPSGFLYQHSILASFVASHILKKVSWGGESQIEKVNFVLFFHDLILAPIYLKYPNFKYEEDLIFKEGVLDKDKEIILNHARLAAEMMVQYKRAPIGVDLLIKQHHGVLNGVGFAVEYRDDISPLSKVIIIAEAFVEEFYRELEKNIDYKLNVKEINNNLRDRFTKMSYKKIIDSLDSMNP